MDASFMAENITMTAESLILGSVFVGSALANDEVIETLKLPRGVLPLTLLCVGYLMNSRQRDQDGLCPPFRILTTVEILLNMK